MVHSVDRGGCIGDWLWDLSLGGRGADYANKAHYALAELASKMKDFVTLSQNVDGKFIRRLAEPKIVQSH